MNPGLILPPALRTSVPRDVLERYRALSYDPRYENMAFPELYNVSKMSPEARTLVHNSIIEEHEAFIQRI